MADEAAGGYAAVRGLARGLSVLRALNQSRDGRASTAQLAEATSIHRTTVRRLLETLAAEGYVRRASDGQYSVALKVRDLSEGFTDREWISAVAAPVMGDLMRRVRWPSDLTTQDGAFMLIRESTHRFSPLSFERGMVGRRMPLLLTASGRAYLAACDQEEREQLISLAAAEGGPQAMMASNRALLSRMLDQVHQRGYAINQGEWMRISRTYALAMSIRHGDRVLGCLNIVYGRRAATLKEAEARYVPPLREAVSQIEALLSEPR